MNVGQMTTVQKWTTSSGYLAPAKDICIGIRAEGPGRDQANRPGGISAACHGDLAQFREPSRVPHVAAAVQDRRIINMFDLCFRLFDGAQRPTAFVLYRPQNQEQAPYRFEYWVPKADLTRQNRRQGLDRCRRMTLVANDLRHQQGQLNAQGGKLKVNSSGELIARQQFQVDADKLKNLQDNLSAEVIGLTLSDALHNDNSLIESKDTLGIDAGTLTNLNGKLRALGSKDRAQFKVGGIFNNDKGLVETGNDRFALDSSSLYNQQGTARDLGTQDSICHWRIATTATFFTLGIMWNLFLESASLHPRHAVAQSPLIR